MRSILLFASFVLSIAGLNAQGLSVRWSYEPVTNPNPYNVILCDPWYNTYGYNTAMSITKHHPNGAVAWTSNLATSIYTGVIPSAGSIDSHGDMYIAGCFGGAVNAGNTILSTSGGMELFLMKIDTSGTPMWGLQSSGNNNSQGIFSDVLMARCANGDIYLTVTLYNITTTIGNVTLNDGTWLIKISSAGNFIWAHNIADFFINGIAPGENNSVILSGMFGDTAQIGGQQIITTDTPGSCVASFDPAGNMQWNKIFGSAYNNDIKSDQHGNISSQATRAIMALSRHSILQPLQAITAMQEKWIPMEIYYG